MSRKPDNATFDIETTGLTPDSSDLVAIAVAHKDQSKVLTTEEKSEQEIVQEFVDMMNRLNNEDRIVTYNGDRFDWPYLIAKSMNFSDYGALTDNLFKLKRFHSHDLFKTHGVNGEDNYLKLEELLERHGIGHDVNLSGDQVPVLVDRGRWQLLKKYALEDAEKTHELYHKLVNNGEKKEG